MDAHEYEFATRAKGTGKSARKKYDKIQNPLCRCFIRRKEFNTLARPQGYTKIHVDD